MIYNLNILADKKFKGFLRYRYEMTKERSKKRSSQIENFFFLF